MPKPEIADSNLCTECKEAGRFIGEHCIDCWPGYDLCADPRCHHYRCEHDIHLGKAVYVRPGCEEQAKEFEDVSHEGCWNEDCPCVRFLERAETVPTENQIVQA